VDDFGVAFATLEVAPLPITFVITTEQLYSVPFVRPVTDTDPDCIGTDLEVDPATHVAVPPVIGEPPSLGGAKARVI
jgi:hypothetical protein